MMSDGLIIRELQRFVRAMVSGAFVGEVVGNADAEAKAVVQVVNGKKIEGEQQLIYDVRLKSVIDELDKHLLLIPKEGSMIMCAPVGNSDERFVAVSYNEIEKIIYKGDNVSLEIDDNAGTVIMNGGENGGLTITPKLVEQLDKLTARVDGIIDAINSPTVIATPQDGGEMLWGLFQTEIAKITEKENFSEIENDKVKH